VTDKGPSSQLPVEIVLSILRLPSDATLILIFSQKSYEVRSTQGRFWRVHIATCCSLALNTSYTHLSF